MRSVPLALAIGLFAMAVRGAEPQPAQAEFFESKIRPLLVARCYECHSAAAAQNRKLRGGLSLDTKAGVLAGGDTGPAVAPGDPDASLLVKAVRYTDSDLKMPPDARLSAAEIALIEQWVQGGAYDPRDEPAAGGVKPQPIDLAVGRRHWAFQAVQKVAPERWAGLREPRANEGQPAAAGADSPLDLFIASALAEAGLSPPEQADKRTLLRRVTFDLVGLPPTPAEIRAFLADDSPEAWPRVVERLLASPRYGERWGRHWLDVVRYADSNGLDENIAHGNAWRYRDYVIRSFNADKPYDRFLIEQLAGDLLNAEDGADPNSSPGRDRLIATGFLALGPKVLAEVDERKMEMDIVDEQVDTLSKSMLGLTIGCARCHDHKFDPISTRDYYALAGILKSTRTMEHFTKIARWWENPIPTADEVAAKADHDARVQKAQAAIAARVAKANADLLARLGGDAKLPGQPEPQYDDQAKADLKKLRDELAALQKSAPPLSTAMGVTEGQPTDLKVHIRGSHLTQGEVAPRGIPAVFVASPPQIQPATVPTAAAADGQTAITSDDNSTGQFDQANLKIPAGRSGRLELARWIASPSHPLTARVFVNRVWRWHFGRGLVPTPDNFGRLGEKPSHPELLDWLAARFVEDGWSLKQLHRQILLSRTYRASSSVRPDAARLDPENRLWSRFPLRRLEAEPIRDALLAVSEGLDLTMGGPAITHVKNREFLFDHTSKDGTTYDAPRRSVYLPVVRNHLYDFFELYDFPDSAVAQGDRPTTTVAPQALLALNSPLVWDAAGRLAADCASSAPEAALPALYERLYGREPDPAEIARCRAFLAQSGGEASRLKRAWQVYCQSLLAANEFIYVR